MQEFPDSRFELNWGLTWRDIYYNMKLQVVRQLVTSPFLDRRSKVSVV